MNSFTISTKAGDMSTAISGGIPIIRTESCWRVGVGRRGHHSANSVPATRILLFTATLGAGDRHRAGLAGVALVQTPIVLHELMAALRQALVSTDDPVRRSITSHPGPS